MARVICNGKLIDGWDKNFQDYIVEKHAFETQKTQGACPDPDYSFEETYGTNKRWLVKK